MKIERLRNNHKKEIILGTILTVVIGGALTYKLTHSKYRVTQSIDLGSGVINYKVPDFKIMAMYKSEDGNNYTEMAASERMPTSGYVIDESKSYCNLNGSKDTTAVLKTIDGNHVISNLIKGDKCFLYFKKGASSAADKILASLGTSIKTGTPDFSKTATTDEGVYSTADGMYSGTTYYFRGAVTNNFVKFAGFCWRIIRINGDKTIRMIYDGSTCHANGTSTADNIAKTNIVYNSAYNASYYVGWTYSNSQRPSTTNNDGSVGTSINAKTQLDSWYSSNLASYESMIADGKFCNDRETISDGSTGYSTNGSAFYYATYKRLYTNKTPTFYCSNAGDVYMLKIGLITADEVAFAGGKYYASDNSSNNTSYYLCNRNNYWTMSPAGWNYNFSTGYDSPPDGWVNAGMFIVNSNGFFETYGVNGTRPGLRPVINLKSDVTFSSGDGTQNNPYTVS